MSTSSPILGSRPNRALLALALGGALLGCNNGFTEGSRVTRLEILAIQSEPPEAPPGAEVTWRALLAKPPGFDSPFVYSFSQCTVTPEGCLEYLEASAFSEGDEAQAEALYNQWALRSGESEVDGLSLELEASGMRLPMSALMSGLPSYEAELTLAVCTEGLCESAPTEPPGERAVKRVVISEGAEPNLNPSIGALDVTEAERVGEADASFTLNLRLEAGSVESYIFVDSDGASEVREERLYVRWYSTAGLFDEGSTSSVDVSEAGGGTSEVTLSFEGEEAGRVGVYAVVRDRRGGVAFTSAELIVGD